MGKADVTQGVPTFEDVWDSEIRILGGVEGAGVGVVDAEVGRASRAKDYHTVFVTSSDFEINAPLPDVVRLFIFLRVSGRFSEMPQLRELFATGAKDFSGLTPEIEKLAVGWAVSTVPASESLRKLVVRYTPEEVALRRFPNLEWLKFCPAARVGVELRSVELLQRLELELQAAGLAKLGLIGRKDHLEYLRVYGGGLKSLAGVERFGALRTAKFALTRVQDFSPLAGTRVRELVIDHRRPNPDGFVGLGEMPELRHLTLETDLAPLTVLADLHRAPVLETLDLQGAGLSDAVIDTVARIEPLRKVVIGGATKRQRARLAAARPDVEIIGGTLDEPPTALQIAQTIDGEWGISCDAAGLIGAPTNYDAERRIRAALDPATRKHLSFDTEAGMFSASSPNRQAIDAVHAAIKHLTPTDQ